MRNLIVIVMVVMLVVVLPATSTGVEYTITTADGNGADTVVQENDENNNNGSSAGMWARWNQGSSRNDHIVLRFDLSGIIGTITNATLNLIKNEDNDPTGPNYIYGVSNGVSGDALADWSETGLTWNNCDWLDRDAPYDDNDLDSTKLTPAFGATFSTAGNKGETKSFSHADLLSFLTDDNN
ncbi:MAG: DNRLRE domain-containing protein, partial [Phycisphaerae bacterium]|nr:DNRLRE domain-containing protein [Phycisphaerae bacterium]